MGDPEKLTVARVIAYLSLAIAAISVLGSAVAAGARETKLSSSIQTNAAGVSANARNVERVREISDGNTKAISDIKLDLTKKVGELSGDVKAMTAQLEAQQKILEDIARRIDR